MLQGGRTDTSCLTFRSSVIIFGQGGVCPAHCTSAVSSQTFSHPRTQTPQLTGYFSVPQHACVTCTCTRKWNLMPLL